MKRTLYLLIVLILLHPVKMMAQNPSVEKLNSYKIAFFTRRLNLTPQEAEKFWPVYNEFQNKRFEIQADRGRMNRNINQNELNRTEKEMIEISDKLISLQMQEALLAQDYHKKFKEILSPQKVIRLYQAENQYRQMLLNQLRDNNQPRRNLAPGDGIEF